MKQRYSIAIEALSLKDYEVDAHNVDDAMKLVMDACFESNLVTFDTDDIGLIIFKATDASGTTAERYLIHEGDAFKVISDEVIDDIINADSAEDAVSILDAVIRSIAGE